MLGPRFEADAPKWLSRITKREGKVCLLRVEEVLIERGPGLLPASGITQQYHKGSVIWLQSFRRQ